MSDDFVLDVRQVTEFPLKPAADPGERAEALLFGAAINRFVAKQLPSTFSVRGDRDAGIGAADVTMVDARYCGAKASGHGRLVGVLRPAS